MNAREIEINENDFEQELNEIYGDVVVCGYSMGQGTILREVDPIAFGCAMSDKPIEYECANFSGSTF